MLIWPQECVISPQMPRILRRCFASRIVGQSNLAVLRTEYCKTSASKKAGGTDEVMQTRSQRIRVNAHAVSVLLGKLRDGFERISTVLAKLGSPITGYRKTVTCRGRPRQNE